MNLYRMSISQANQRDIGDSSVKFGESSVKYGENSAKSDVDSVMFIDGIIIRHGAARGGYWEIRICR